MMLTSRIGASLMVLLIGGPSLASAQDVPAEYQQVLTTLGKQGDFKDKVLKVNIPRNDVKGTVAGVATPTPFGFGGWVAMTKGDGGHDVLMGDLVLLQDEVNPVMSALLDNGFDVTALHKSLLLGRAAHVLRARPRTWDAGGTRAEAVVAIHHHMTNDRPMIVFLHYWGTGPAEKLAIGFKAAVNELGKHGAASTR